MESKHTPGPWSVLAEGRLIENAKTYIAKAHTQKTKGEAEANARLIAAAPELLEACKESLQWIAKVSADHDGHGDGISLFAKRQLPRAQKAIDKAEGSQPGEELKTAPGWHLKPDGQAAKSPEMEAAENKCLRCGREINDGEVYHKDSTGTIVDGELDEDDTVDFWCDDESCER